MTGQSSIQDILFFPQMRPEKKAVADPVEAYTAIGVPEEWVPVIQKMGYLTVDFAAQTLAGQVLQRPVRLQQEKQARAEGPLDRGGQGVVRTCLIPTRGGEAGDSGPAAGGPEKKDTVFPEAKELKWKENSIYIKVKNSYEKENRCRQLEDEYASCRRSRTGKGRRSRTRRGMLVRELHRLPAVHPPGDGRRGPEGVRTSLWVPRTAPPRPRVPTRVRSQPR